MKAYLFMIILTMIFTFFIIGGIIYLELREDFICNIGEKEIAGDFKVDTDTMFNNHYCAVEDCVAFNDYNEKKGNEERCVV